MADKCIARRCTLTVALFFTVLRLYYDCYSTFQLLCSVRAATSTAVHEHRICEKLDILSKSRLYRCHIANVYSSCVIKVLITFKTMYSMQ